MTPIPSGERRRLVPAHSRAPLAAGKYFNYKTRFYAPCVIVKTLKPHFRDNKMQRRLWLCVEPHGVTCGGRLSRRKQPETPGKLGRKERPSAGPRGLAVLGVAGRDGPRGRGGPESRCSAAVWTERPARC